MKGKILLFLGIVLCLVGFSSSVYANSLADRMAGKILLQVEESGEGWYVDPDTQKRAYLGRPADAFRIMRELGLGIAHEQLQKYLDSQFPSNLAGKILLDVEENGEAYYVDPDTLEGYFLGKPKDAFQVMRERGEGVSNENLDKIAVQEKYKKSKEEKEKPMMQVELEMIARSGGTTTPAPGTHSFDEGKEITVKAEPDTGYEFTAWEREGDAVNCEREEKECTFEINEDSMLAAHFTEKGVVEKCDNDTECGWKSVNCCPENAGAEWECVNKEETNIDCPDNPTCLQFVSPKPETSCICSNGECQEDN